MAKETATGASNDNPFFSHSAMDSMKEFWGFQMKLSQTLAEQTMKMGQTWTDFAYTQVQDAAKVSHDCVKQGLTLAEETRKGLHHFSEKMTKNN